MSKKKIIEYSKLWITLWQVFCMFWISVFLISDIKQNQGLNSQTVIESLIVSVVAIFIPYLAKAFLGKMKEEETRLKELEIESSGMEDKE